MYMYHRTSQTPLSFETLLIRGSVQAFVMDVGSLMGSGGLGVLRFRVEGFGFRV